MNDDILIDRISELMEKKEFNQAKEFIIKKLKSIPDPKYAYEKAQILYLMLGDIYYYQDKPVESLDAFLKASLTPFGNMHPFINLRVAQNYFELNFLNRTSEYLLKAYEIAGYDIFEDENPIFKEILNDTLTEIETDLKSDSHARDLIDQSREFWDDKEYLSCLNLLEQAWFYLDDYKYESVHSYLIISGALECSLSLKDTKSIKEWLEHLKQIDLDGSSDKYKDLLYAKAYFQLNDLDQSYEYFDSYYKQNDGEILDADDQLYLKFYLEKREILSFKS